MDRDWFEFNIGIERKKAPVFEKAIERIAVKMISVREVARPVRIRVMGRDDFNPSTGPGYPMHLGHISHHIRNMFRGMTADDLVELIVGKRIRHYATVVNDVGRSAWVDVHPDRTGVFIAAASNIEDLFSSGHSGRLRCWHQLISFELAVR